MTLRSTLKILGLLATMTVGGLAGMFLAITFLMNLGLKLHDNYEYYGGLPGKLLVFGSVTIGFFAPLFLVAYLDKNSWRISLRTLFIVITIVAVLLGIYCSSL